MSTGNITVGGITTAAEWSFTPAPPPPITASYRRASGTPVFTEPYQCAFREEGLLMTIRFMHAGTIVQISSIDVTVMGVTRTVPILLSVLTHTDELTFPYLLPY